MIANRLLIPLSLLLTILLHLSTLNAQPLIERVEPPSWWTGMAQPDLQLLIHGNNISGLRPSLDYAGVTLERITRVENPNYLFLDLHISPNAAAGTFAIAFNREGKVVFSYDYPLQQRRAGSAARRGFSNQDILYLITPDRFANGDESNDSVDGMKESANRAKNYGRHGGDIKGIIDQLDYISDMGFTVIWLNPVLENDMPRYSYHGYATTDFYQVDARLGSNQDYRLLSAEARKRGMLVIADMIANHCGLHHWWTDDLPTADWYNFQERAKKPYSTHRRTTLADPYAADIDRKMHSDGWFSRNMPDLNQRNPLLANYLIQNSIWWVEYADIGGIRQDTYPYPDPRFMANWAERMMQEYPNFNIVGEEWSENPAIVSRWQAGKKNANGYRSYLPSVMDFPLQEVLASSIAKKPAPFSNTFDAVYKMLGNDFLYPDPFNLVVFLDNHDMSRFINQVGEDLNLFKMGIVYLYTTRGIPQIFYGTEVLISNPDNPKDHALIRSDMPGGWPGDTLNAFTGEGLSREQREAKAFLRTMTRFRRDTPVLHNGQLRHFAPANDIYVMFRYDKGSKIMSVFNKHSKQVSVDLKRFEEVLDGAVRATDVVSGEAQDLRKGKIAVPANSGKMYIVE